MNNRRKLAIALGAGALAAPLAGFAQQRTKTIPRIGYLALRDGSHKPFRQGLGELGYVEDKNIIVEYRFAGGNMQKLPGLAAELIRLKIDVLVAPDPPSFAAARNATKTIPIIMRSSADPVENGWVSSLAHPGGNITGIFSLYSELNGKRLELLKETYPALARVLLLWDKTYEPERGRMEGAQRAAHALGLQSPPVAISSDKEIDDAIRKAVEHKANGMLALRSPLILSSAAKIASIATRHRLPAIYDESSYTEAGGMMSYGANLPDIYRQLATYVDKTLRGAKPGDLPIEQPTRFELIINMKTAKTLGIKIPNSILVQATRVIE